MIVAGDLKQIQISSYVIPFWARASSNSILQRRKMKCDYFLVKRLKLNFLKTTLSKKKKHHTFLLAFLISFISEEVCFKWGGKEGFIQVFLRKQREVPSALDTSLRKKMRIMG